MKNDLKILIGAIVVILVILTGAFALSSPGPTPGQTSPAATPTVTPIPVDSGGMPTIVPGVTPAPAGEPESGVKQTEYGYWITYPPLGPQYWSNDLPSGH